LLPNTGKVAAGGRAPRLARPASMPRFRRKVFVKQHDVRRNCRSDFVEVVVDQCIRMVDAAERPPDLAAEVDRLLGR
jgi:hypothetical protein